MCQVISDSLEHQQNQLEFSHPELLQILRENLMKMKYQEDMSYHKRIITQISQQYESRQNFNNSSTEETLNTVMHSIQDFYESLTQKSENINILVDLSVKMIDFISEERQQAISLQQKYDFEREKYLQIIQELNKKTYSCQNDIEVFRERLKAAQQQLEDIQERKQKHFKMEGQIDRNHFENQQIQFLQNEMIRMKEELQRYKRRRHRRLSIIQPDANNNSFGESRNFQRKQPKNIPQDENEINTEKLIYIYEETIFDLQKQNDNLRVEIEKIKNQKTKKDQFQEKPLFRQLYGPSAIKFQEIVNSCVSINITNEQKSLMPHKSLSIKSFHKKNQFHMLRSQNKLEMKQDLISEQSEKSIIKDLSNKKQNLRPLNTEMSNQSFDFRLNNNNIDTRRDIYELRENEGEIIENNNYFLSKYHLLEVGEDDRFHKCIKETESSSKILKKYSVESLIENKQAQPIKQYCEIGINTELESTKVSSTSQQQHCSVFNKMKNANIFKTLQNFIITQRIQKYKIRTKSIYFN